MKALLLLLLAVDDGGSEIFYFNTSHTPVVSVPYSEPTTVSIYDEPDGGWLLKCANGVSPSVKREHGDVRLSCKPEKR